MTAIYDPHQIPLFPDMFEDYLPPLTSQPDFAQELENFVKIAEYGALLEVNFKGFEKSYTLRMNELHLLPEYWLEGCEEQSPVFYLLPAEIRREMERFRYRVKAFFDHHNSIKTAHGYFLFRNYTLRWERHRAALLEQLQSFLQERVGNDLYRQYFDQMLQAGLNWLKAQLSSAAPYVTAYPGHGALIELRRNLIGMGATLSNLDATREDYLIQVVALKTMHIPSNLSQYLKGLTIDGVYKTIHLDYLKGFKVESLRDVRYLLAHLAKLKP